MILPIVELIEWLIARGGIELINLGKLKEIKDLRKVWPHEASWFEHYVVWTIRTGCSEYKNWKTAWRRILTESRLLQA